MLLIGGVAATVVALLVRWSAPDRDWTDVHRLAIILGALPASMLFGFFFVTVGNRIDQIAQGGASLATLGLLTLFGRRLAHRDRPHESAAPEEPALHEAAETRS
jgi:hypothetical protein